VFGKDALAERLTLHKRDCFNPAQPAGGKAKATDAAKGVNHAKICHQNGAGGRLR
jgi:hypothetical protein